MPAEFDDWLLIWSAGTLICERCAQWRATNRTHDEYSTFCKTWNQSSGGQWTCGHCAQQSGRI